MKSSEFRGSAMDRLLAEIEAEMRMTRRETGRDRLDPRVASALRAVPRHHYVPDAERDAAYANIPLPIGHGQTISQPFIVALMTELLDLEPESVVLEVGAGSGYQAAVLSRLAGRVYSLELRPELADAARRRLEAHGCDNVTVIQADGYQGWPEEAPYDAIIVTAASPDVPAPLREQLADGGRLVAPVGPRYSQQLIRIRREGDQYRRENLLGVAFVPLIGEHGWDKRGTVRWGEEEPE